MSLTLSGLKSPLPRPKSNVIAHIGVGGFHRSHLAKIVHDLALNHNSPYRIVGVGLMPWDLRMRDALRPQDYLYALRMRDVGVDEVEVVQSIVGFAFVPEDAGAVERLSGDEVKIICEFDTKYCEVRFCLVFLCNVY